MESETPSVRTFVKAFRRHWFAAMSGGFSVPFAFGAALAPNEAVKYVLLALAFLGAWYAAYTVWRSERLRLINLQRSTDDRKEQKQRLLDEIGELRIKLGTMRIEMEQDHSCRRYSESEWKPKFDSLEDEIASKVEQFSSPAEAHLYRHRGNINRPLNPVAGGFLNPLLVDICIHDSGHLKNFIQDYSRQKERTLDQ
jgi:hypothetical protein